MTARPRFAKWTPEIIAKATAMKAEGRTSAVIGAVIGLPTGSVTHFFNDRGKGGGKARKTANVTVRSDLFSEPTLRRFSWQTE